MVPHGKYNDLIRKKITDIHNLYTIESKTIKPDIAKANAINRIRNLQNDFQQKMSAYYTGEPVSINKFH